jgi:hypothetical protein
MAQNIERELQEQISRLPNEQQRLVLDFARSLASLPHSNGGSGEALLRYAGTIEQDDLAIMEQAIAEGCETINPDEW